MPVPRRAKKTELEVWTNRLGTDDAFWRDMQEQAVDDPDFAEILERWEALQPAAAAELHAHEAAVRNLLAPVYAEFFLLLL